jgi:hypothetical protein
LLGLPQFKPRQAEAVTRAVAWYQEGMDFGDALHLSLSEADAAFASFDVRLQNIARRLDTSPPVTRPR